jgi:hypothetical protein
MIPLNKKILITILVSFALWSCNPVKQGNMKWIAKYDFNQLYQLTDQATFLDPMSAFRFEEFIAADENTIILIGNKDLNAFDSIQNGDQAVLHISKDRGKSYQELLLPEQEMRWIYPSQDYSLIKAQSRLPDNSKKNSMYLLDHKSLKVVKIDEYDSESDISYYNFNGKYAVYSHNKALKLVNLLNREEEYPLPYELNNRSFWVTADDTLLILDAKQLIRYDPKNNTQTVIQQLHNDYDVLVYEDGEYFFTKFNTSKGGGTYYNSKEELLYTFEKGDRNRYYRYKNFACDYKLTSALYPIFRYSYDYGKTWFEQKFTGFFIASRPVGFYKDKFIILDATFYDKNERDGGGGRLLIAEFEK